MNSRESVVDKIRGLMAKTVENGCTEAEAMIALAKARAMMDAWDVSEEDLRLTKEQGAALHREDKKDIHNIRYYMSRAIAIFTETRIYREVSTGSLVAVGVRSDTELAMYLLDALQIFVINELNKYLFENPVHHSRTRRVINGFVEGCCYRISERLRQLAAEARPTATGTALIVAKKALVEEALEREGITLTKGKSTNTKVDYASYQSGKEAGDRATFGRPVGGGTGRIGKE